MHPTVMGSLFIVTTAFVMMVFAQPGYTPDPYNSQQRYNSQDPYSNQQSRYNNPDSLNNQDRYGNSDRYGQDGRNDDRYGTNNQDRFGNNQDRLGNNQDRYGNTQDRYGNNQDRYGNNQDRYGNNQDRYGNNQDRYGNNQDRYGNNQDRDRYGTNQDRDRYGNNQDRDRYGGGSQDRYGNRQPYNPQYGQGGGNFDRFGSGDDNCCEDYCYRRQESYLLFGPKTAYQFSVRQRRNDQFNVPQCQPVLFWLLAKQGASLPDERLISRLRNLENIRQQIIINYEKQQFPRTGRLCDDDLDLFKRWHWNNSVSEDRAYSLSTQGAEDLRILARKLQTGMKNLLDQPYTEHYFKFQYTDSEKTHDSYQAFIEGLFPTSLYRIHAEVKPEDRFGLGYNSRCNRNSYESSDNYQTNNYLDNNQRDNYQRSGSNYQSSRSGYQSGGAGYQPGGSGYQSGGAGYQSGGAGYQSGGAGYQTGGAGYQSGYNQPGGYRQEYGLGGINSEQYRFKQKPEYKDAIRDISRKLGFKYNMNETIIEDMYEMCRHEKAWYPRDPAPWCAAFSEKQLKIFEYAEDLKYYYEHGYGNQYNSGSCEYLTDLFDRFEKTVNGYGESQKVVANFANSKALLQLLVSLGVARDVNPPTADNYVTQSRRHWKTSNLVPFGGNLVAILHQCQGSDDSYKVMFLLNEYPLEIPGCSVGLCTWNTFRDKVNEAMRMCNVEGCNGGTDIRSNFVFLSTSFLLALLISRQLFVR